jgi:hypothetical protein
MKTEARNDARSQNAARLRPLQVCRALLAALEASEGRRRARKRNQTPDAIGLDTKRALLEAALRDDPDPSTFEAWLLQYAAGEGARAGHGSAWAMAQAVMEEWRLALAMPQFALWLADGAPSADADEPAIGAAAGPQDRGGRMESRATDS